jgi:hypothetical protein
LEDFKQSKKTFQVDKKAFVSCYHFDQSSWFNSWWTYESLGFRDDWMAESYFQRKHYLLWWRTTVFLERVCNEIIELDNGKLYQYKGNYYYLEKKKNVALKIQV